MRQNFPSLAETLITQDFPNFNRDYRLLKHHRISLISTETIDVLNNAGFP